MKKLRTKLVPARNKLIGHLDHEAVLAGDPLGAAHTDEWNQFWLDLQEFLRILQRRFVDPASDFYLNAVGQISDAHLLVKALKESTYFNDILNDVSQTKEVGEVAFRSKYYDA
jgi:hypothetical protein